MAGNKYYAVVRGYNPGIYDNWPDTQRQVNGFPGGYQKKAANLEDAAKILLDNGFSTEAVEKMKNNINGASNIVTATNTAAAKNNAAANTATATDNDYAFVDGATIPTDYVYLHTSLKNEKNRYILVLHPCRFVFDASTKSAPGYSKLQMYLNAKAFSKISDYIHIYKFENENKAVAAAASDEVVSASASDEVAPTTTSNEGVPTSESDKERYKEYTKNTIDSGVYLVIQKAALIDAKAKIGEALWGQIQKFQGLNAFTAFGYNQKVYEYVKGHLDYYEEPNFYKDIYKDSDKTLIFTDGSAEGDKIGYGVYFPSNKDEEMGGHDLTEIINLSKEIRRSNEDAISKECVSLFEDAQKAISDGDKYNKERNETAELWAVMHAVLAAKIAEKKEINIVHDNENVMKYLTGEYKGKDTLCIELGQPEYNSFNEIYCLFFREVEKWDMTIRFIHVYSHVRDKDKDNDEEEMGYPTKLKSISLKNQTVFDNHTLFEGNSRVDKLADEYLNK